MDLIQFRSVLAVGNVYGVESVAKCEGAIGHLIPVEGSVHDDSRLPFEPVSIVDPDPEGIVAGGGSCNASKEVVPARPNGLHNKADAVRRYIFGGSGPGLETTYHIGASGGSSIRLDDPVGAHLSAFGFQPKFVHADDRGIARISQPITVRVQLTGVGGFRAIIQIVADVVEWRTTGKQGIGGITEAVVVEISIVHLSLAPVRIERVAVFAVRHSVAVVVGVTDVAQTVTVRIRQVGRGSRRTVIQIIADVAGWSLTRLDRIVGVTVPVAVKIGVEGGL